MLQNVHTTSYKAFESSKYVNQINAKEVYQYQTWSNEFLIMASVVHNYSDPAIYPCIDNSTPKEIHKLFEIIRQVENSEPMHPPTRLN